MEKAKAPGADFATLAKDNSQCPSASRGGDLGYFVREQMVPEFSDAAFKMKTGEISPVVKTQFGYHIIMVTDHKPAGQQTLEEATPMIVQMLENQNGEAKVKEFIAGLRKTADIKITL